MQAGEPILAQPGRQARCGLVGVLEAIARVAVIADEVSQLPAGLAHGLDDGLVPEQRAIRAVVTDQHPGGLALLERLAHPLASFLVAIVALQHP